MSHPPLTAEAQARPVPDLARPRPRDRRAAARRAVEVLAALTASDLRLRYGRGRARMLKWLLDPVAAVGVYLLLVQFVLARPGGAWGLSLACAVFPFQLVMMTIINAMGTVRLRQSIIANMDFPRGLLPISSALTESVAFGGTLVLLAVMIVSYGVEITSSLLWMFLAVGVTLVFAAACAYPAALIGLWFRELHNFVVSGVRTVFFLSTGLVALNEVHGRAHDLLRLNPLTGIFESYRAAIIAGQAPEWWMVLYPLGFGAVLTVLALPIYRREQPHFAKVSES